jgi:hypothetical protein
MIGHSLCARLENFFHPLPMLFARNGGKSDSLGSKAPPLKLHSEMRILVPAIFEAQARQKCVWPARSPKALAFAKILFWHSRIRGCSRNRIG